MQATETGGCEGWDSSLGEHVEAPEWLRLAVFLTFSTSDRPGRGGKKQKNDNNIFFSVSLCWLLQKRLNVKCICSSKHNFDPCSKLSIPQAVKHLLSPGWHVKKGRSITTPDTNIKEVLARQNLVASLHIQSIIIPLNLHLLCSYSCFGSQEVVERNPVDKRLEQTPDRLQPVHNIHTPI